MKWFRFSPMSLHHPWNKLRRMKHIKLAWVDMPDAEHGKHPIRGATNGYDTVWLDRHLLYEERRCTLEHELEHIERGHAGCQDEKTEADVRRTVARRLIDWNDLVDAVSWSLSVEEAAAELAVTVDVLHDRISYLHPKCKTLLRQSGSTSETSKTKLASDNEVERNQYFNEHQHRL